MRRLKLVLFALMLASGAHSDAALAADKVQFLIGGRSLDESQAQFIVAKYLGYFTQEGLDVDLLAVGGANEIAIQIATGNATFGSVSPAQAIVGMQTSATTPWDVRYFYNATYRNIWSMSVPADSKVKAVGELRGKKIGIVSMSSGGITYAKVFLRSAGLDPDKDVTFMRSYSGGQQTLVSSSMASPYVTSMSVKS
jgi:NitT/TauT family transport system substrate-binding protein